MDEDIDDKFGARSQKIRHGLKYTNPSKET